VYLLDYGLVYRFNPEGNHKEYKEDPKRKHDGTAEFTSRDAHNGVGKDNDRGCRAAQLSSSCFHFLIEQWIYHEIQFSI